MWMRGMWICKWGGMWNEFESMWICEGGVYEFVSYGVCEFVNEGCVNL